MGIGTTAPDASAALDIVSSTKGALLPCVALTSAVPTPATGLLVFQTGATPGFYYNAGTPGAPNWQQIATAAGAAVTANNGLTKTGQSIQLGGTLVQATTIAQGGFAFNHLGGNVGVGTATPGAALDVQGDFRVSTTVNAAGQIAQLVNQSDTRVTSPGQSFTLPTAASITSVGFYPDYLNSGPAATLNIYQGSGTSGTLLVSQAVTMTTGAPYIATLTTPLALPAGQYTFVFAGADVQFNFALSDVYAGGNLFLGTTSYPQWDLRFLVNYTTVQAGPVSLISSAAGNVGIGTATPGQKLEVAGQIFSNTGGFRFPDNTVQTTATTTGPAGAAGPAGATGVAGPQGSAGATGATGSTATVAAANGLSATTASGVTTLTLGGTLTAATTVANAGFALNVTGAGTTSFGSNVGISTTTPLVPLSVAPNNLGPKLTLWDAGSTTQHYGFGISPNQLNYQVQGTADHVFSKGGKNNDGTEEMRLQGSSGNLGIGTATPGQKLEVAGQIFSNTGGFRFPDNTVQTTATTTGPAGAAGPAGATGVAGPQGSAGATGSTGPVGPVGSIGATGAAGSTANVAAANGLSATTASGVTTIMLGGALTAATTITQAGYPFGLTGGNVGIGTSAPTQVLDVNGGILARYNSAISNQGAYLQWNRSGGDGETWLINHLGGGTGNAGIRFGGITTSSGTTVTEWARIDNSGNMAINATSANGYRLYVNGTIAGVSYSNISDQRLKTDIRPLTGALGLVQVLHGRRYQWNAQGVALGGIAGREQIGVIAQELETVLPELVSTGTDGIKTVNYAQLTPVLIEALKELSQQVQTLQTQNAILQAKSDQTTADHASLLTVQAQLARLLGDNSPANAQARK